MNFYNDDETVYYINDLTEDYITKMKLEQENSQLKDIIRSILKAVRDTNPEIILKYPQFLLKGQTNG